MQFGNDENARALWVWVRKEGRKEGRTDGRKEGRKEGGREGSGYTAVQLRTERGEGRETHFFF